MNTIPTQCFEIPLDSIMAAVNFLCEVDLVIQQQRVALLFELAKAAKAPKYFEEVRSHPFLDLGLDIGESYAWGVHLLDELINRLKSLGGYQFLGVGG